MNGTTVALDLAKSVFEVAVADQNWKVVDRARLSRTQLEPWFHNRAVGLVVSEPCILSMAPHTTVDAIGLLLAPIAGPEVR